MYVGTTKYLLFEYFFYVFLRATEHSRNGSLFNGLSNDFK